MTEIGLILVCLAAGALLRWGGKLPDSTPRVLNTFAVYLALPALIFVQIHGLDSTLMKSHEMWIPISMAWIEFLLAVLFFWAVGKSFRWEPKTVRALMLTAGLANTSFVGFPLLEALLGRRAIGVGVVTDQAGSYLVLATLGVVVGSFGSGRTPRIGDIAKRIFTFPPTLAAIAALLFIRIEIPSAILGIIERLGATLVPLVLTAVGFQLELDPKQLLLKKKELGMGLLYKLVLAPLVLVALYVGILQSFSFSTRVTLLESAMAPMIGGAILASELGLDDEIASLMLGVGIPLSLLTVPLWNWALGWLGLYQT